jgi:hypothetical protein
MPNSLRPVLLALATTGVVLVMAGCGGNSGPPASIPSENAAILTSKIDEIEANVRVGSCFVAAEKTDDLLADINDLPSGVNQDVQNALTRGATNLKGLLEDPSQCQGRTTTTTPSTTESTTESTTTTKTQPSTTTTRTQTRSTPTIQTQTTQTSPSGGVGPGSPGGL